MSQPAMPAQSVPRANADPAALAEIDSFDTLPCAGIELKPNPSARALGLVEDWGDTDRVPGVLPQVGEVIGGSYRITRELGRGSMGIVFEAIDERLLRPVALKLIRPELLRPGFVRRFMHEAQAMARVSHPGVVGIYALGEYEATPYFVMEHVDGQTLEVWLASNSGDLTARFRILDEICRGVAAIHAAGAVHRDLKPSDGLLDRDLHGRVADFGLSTLAEDPLTADGIGTLAYMAPELSLSYGERAAAKPVSDVYSLACMAYELLTGEHPFTPSRRAVSGVRHAFEPPAASHVQPDLPSAIDRVLAQALSANPANRTPTVEAFQHGLNQARSGNPERILIAEDDDDFREVLRESLALEFPLADIQGVSNGTQALAALDSTLACVAIVDLQMPGLDGLTLTGLLRNRPRAARMPIIILSGSGGASEWKQLAMLGADRFLLKPVSLSDIAIQIRQALLERATLSGSAVWPHVAL
jgi:eukaryotic-like serine/threonine-protein kinase